MTSATVTKTAPSKINWPSEFEPASHTIYAINSIETSASPAEVWRLLVNARGWPDYYPNATDVEIEGGAAELTDGAKFIWSTAGVKLDCTVREFVPFERISWDALYEGSAAYHGWLITPSARGANIHTEETQHGPFWDQVAADHPGILHQFHQQWVETLSEAASASRAAA
jgi:uncharacterized protein YndB with AHSA1/START domain